MPTSGKTRKEDLITGRKEMFYVVSLEVHAHLWQNTQRMNENKPKKI